jgi:hypothetical protein
VAANSKLPQTCWICGKMVSLESCIVDEHGLAMHENCSVAKIASRPDASAPQNELPLNLDVVYLTSDKAYRSGPTQPDFAAP